MVAIFVLLTFLVFILVDLLVLKAQKKTHPAFEPKYQVADLSVFTKNSLNIPEGIFLSRGHTWAQKNQYGLIKIGIDEFVLKALGKLSIINVAPVGKDIKKGDVIFEGKFNSKQLKFRSPVDGTVKFINPDIHDKRITDPFGDHWGVLVASPNYSENTKKLLSGIEIEKWMKSEFRKLRDFLGSHAPRPELAGVTMQDGGNVVEGAVALINDENLVEFEKEFLLI